MMALASARSSHGGPPVARASSRLRWRARCCWPVRRIPCSAPMPVFTPYTGTPVAKQDPGLVDSALAGRPATPGPMLTASPAAIARTTSRSESAPSAIVTAATASGT